MIRKHLPKTAYERESLLKSFLLFFLTIEVLLGVISFLVYRIEMTDLKERIFLEMKNYSYTFKGEKFRVDVVPAKVYGNRFYELIETAAGLSIVIPVPGSEEDALLIYYPWYRFEFDRNTIAFKTFLMFLSSSFFSLLVSFIFALYSINPLRKALQMIEEVTRDIIHDLNTPLTTLRVNLKILKSRYKDEEIERAEIALKQLETLRENLRPLEVKRELKLEEIELEKLLREEVEVFKKAYPEKKVYLELENVRVRADRDAVLRIISNLLENAFRYSSRGGWVRVILKDGLIVVENPAKPPENLEKLFERYYRESQRGLGLGLAIVKKLCEELGWEVKLAYNNGIFRAEVLLKNPQQVT